MPKNQRVVWGYAERDAYIKQWYEHLFETPEGGWGPYDIHHILPQEYGGSNDFWNLVPAERTIDHKKFNTWWAGCK